MFMLRSWIRASPSRETVPGLRESSGQGRHEVGGPTSGGISAVFVHGGQIVLGGATVGLSTGDILPRAVCESKQSARLSNAGCSPEKGGRPYGCGHRGLGGWNRTVGDGGIASFGRGSSRVPLSHRRPCPALDLPVSALHLSYRHGGQKL